jgi:hypothetical protein
VVKVERCLDSDRVPVGDNSSSEWTVPFRLQVGSEDVIEPLPVEFYACSWKYCDLSRHKGSKFLGVWVRSQCFWDVASFVCLPESPKRAGVDRDCRYNRALMIVRIPRLGKTTLFFLCASDGKKISDITNSI